MNPGAITREWTRLVRRLRPHAGKLALVLLGFAVGALAFGGSDAGDPHADHAREQPSAGTPPAAARVWTCAMHPQIRQSGPGPCPLCGMDLVPVTGGDSVDGESAAPRVVLSERARALARLQTTAVRRRDGAAGAVRLLGRIEPDESSLRSVTAWTAGRIDRLHASVTGERVRAGQVVATLYSPELYAAHQDLLVALAQVQRLLGSAEPSRQAAAAALEATRERLRLLGVPDDELASLEKRERPTRAVSVRTPFAGTILERVATEGAYVAAGAPLYRLADLSRVWVQLDAYESDLARLAKGQRVLVQVEALPGEQIEGRVAFIDPTLDARRRTLRVRVEVDNGDGRLRPGMFAEAAVLSDGAGAAHDGGPGPLVVPASAPLFTGQRALVYVESRQGERWAYEPRSVRLGPRLGPVYPVVSGLSEGERVVSRGAFAVDADLQIRGGASLMSAERSATVEDATTDDAMGEAASGAAASGAAASGAAARGERGSSDLSRGERARLAPVVTAYLELQRALAADDLSAARQAGAALGGQLAGSNPQGPAQAAAAWAKLSATLRQHAQRVGEAADLGQARVSFEELSASVARLLQRFGNPLDAPLQLAFCPMARGNRGALWIQQGDAIDNAYFGQGMRSCGEVRERIAPGARLSDPAGSDAAGSRAGGGR